MKIDELKLQQEKMDKYYDQLLSKLSKKQHKLQEQIDALNKQCFKLRYDKSTNFHNYQDKIQKICKHDKYPVRKRCNNRDDASFQYWLSCSNCDKDLGNEF